MVPSDSSWQFDHSVCGVVGSHCCQAPSTDPAAAHGHSRVNRAMGGTGCTPNVNDVTTPKLPPPPPRQAQNRSSLADADAVSSRPSAVTTSSDCTLSHVSPKLRPNTPTPPPNVSPAMPTVGHDPPGSTTPDCPRVLYTSINRAPAPTTAVARSWATVTVAIRVTSTTSPVLSE